MKFAQIGTIAVPFENHHSVDLLKELNFTSTEGHEVTSTFQKAQNILDTLERNSTGTLQDFELLSSIIVWLPHNSEERLECDIRIRSFKKRWGIGFKTSRQQKPTGKVKLAFAVNNIEQIMIEEKHSEFINSGKDARRWIIGQLSKSATKEFNSKAEIVSVVEEQLQLLEDLLKTVKTSEKNVAIIKAFQTLQLKSFEKSNAEIQQFIITKWVKTSRNQINTLTQLNLEIDNFCKKALMENQSPIRSTLNYEQFNKLMSAQ